MTLDKPPYGHGMFFIAVKGPVHKFYLRHSGLQEISQLIKDQFQASEPYALINRGQAVAARKGAAPAALVINDAVLQILYIHMLIWKWYPAHIHGPAYTGICQRTIGEAKGKPGYIFQTGLSVRQDFSTVCPFFTQLIHIISGQLCKCFLSLSLHDACCLRQLPKHFSCIKGHLRSSQPYGHIRQYFP